MGRRGEEGPESAVSEAVDREGLDRSATSERGGDRIWALKALVTGEKACIISWNRYITLMIIFIEGSVSLISRTLDEVGQLLNFLQHLGKFCHLTGQIINFETTKVSALSGYRRDTL